MCTGLIYKTKDFYFGRTLDYDYSYHEEIIIMPRNFPLKFKYLKTLNKHYAIIGMAYCQDNYPLYYDASNEKGLCIAGLNFVNNACFFNVDKNKVNVAQFEFIPYLLATCKSVKEVKERLKNLVITKTSFNKNLKPASLHYLIADNKECITVEQVKDGLKIYENKVGVLTNNPPFPMQMFNLNNYLNVTSNAPHNVFSNKIDLEVYSRGLGGLGLPGDLSSQSRFVRASFVKLNSLSNDDEISSINQFFHILDSVEQQRGCCKVNESYEITIYASCINARKGIYYYKTYDNHQINAVRLFKEDLNSTSVRRFTLNNKENITYQN